MRLKNLLGTLTTLSLALVAATVHAGNRSIPVQIVNTGKSGWELRRGGDPYFVKGGCIVRFDIWSLS